jgi:hypothetical protein
MVQNNFRTLVSIVAIACCASACASLGKLGLGDASASSPSASAKSGGAAGANIANPQSVQVFNDNKDNLQASLKALQDFAGKNDAMEQRDGAGEAGDYIKLAEATLGNLRSGIIEGIDEFQANYSEAKSFLLKGKMGQLDTAIEKANDALSGVRKTLLRDIESEVEWLSSTHASAQNAPKAIESINNYYALLNKLWKDDAEINAHKEKNIPLAKASYDRVMKQTAKNTMPKSAYTGADKAALEKSIVDAYKERYASDQVARVVIVSANWQQQTEVVDDNVKRYIKTYLVISAHVAVKHGDMANVFVLTFRKPKDGGKLELGGVGNSYPVLMKNINK